MFKEGYDIVQLEEMNVALFSVLALHYKNYTETKKYILKAKTAFFQPASELSAIAKRLIEDEFDLSPRGWARFRTQKDAIERRKTHHYRDGYSHMDEFEYVGRAEIISCEMHRDYDGCDETTSAVYTLRVIEMFGEEQDFQNGLDDHFSGSNCTHDYDCCGCWHYHVGEIEKIHLGNVALFKVPVHGSRNY